MPFFSSATPRTEKHGNMNTISLALHSIEAVIFRDPRTERRARINIKEVAQAAGVSVATISRVLNHPERVQNETKQHVLEVMQKLGYKPSWIARSLSVKKTGTIALFVPNIEDRRFVDMITGIETVAQEKDYTVLLCNTHADPEQELKYLNMAMKRQVDGIILVSSQLSSLSPVLEAGFPWIHIGSRAPEPCQNLCLIHYEKGAYQMTSHLIQLGHRDISLLLDEAPLAEMGFITEGYLRALKEHGLSPHQEPVRTENSVQGGYLAAQKLIQSGCLPQAIITSSDEQAFGVARAAEEEHLQIPDRLALACLKDSQLCAIFSPPITALELPSHRIGLVAARMLFDCLEYETAPVVPQEISLQPKLKIRRSCGNTAPIY